MSFWSTKMRTSLGWLVIAVFALIGYAVYMHLTVNATRQDPGDLVALQQNGKNEVVAAAGGNGLPTVPPSARQQEQTATTERELNPAVDGWQTESFSDAAAKQLKIVAKMIESGEVLAANKPSIFADRFRCTPLHPEDLEYAIRDDTMMVRRSQVVSKSSESKFSWLDSFKSAIAGLPASDNRDDCHVKFKIIGVDLDEDFSATANRSAITVVYAEGFGRTPAGRPTQWTATWDCEWEVLDARPPLLATIHLVEYEEVEAFANSTWLQDDTTRVFANDAGYRQQLAKGMDYWLTQLSGRLRVSRLGHNGLAIGDVNGDNRPDIFVCQSGGLPNRLYVQQADGTVRDVSAEAGVDYLDDTTCALLVDLDNDGDQDLALATVAGGLVLSNDGAGRFEQAAYLPQCRNAFSLTAADYDQDGLLDLYVGRYWPSSENRGEIPIPVPYFDGKNGGANIMLRNQGDWKFEDTTKATGLDDDNTRYTMAAAWDDIDDDGDVDLYVANDFGKNCLYENDGGQFRNIASDASVEDIASGMSVTFSDVDRDGHTDIYVSNMFSSAGNRIAYQRQYEERFDGEGVKSLRRMARGNSMFRNAGNGSFQDVSVSTATTMGRWSWGSLFADINNDGWDDLLIANGNITAEKPGDL